MANSIGGVNPIEAPGIGSAGGPTAQPAATAKPQTSAAPVVDSADLSGAKALLTAISQSSATVSVVDQQLVGQLQVALNSGTYQADPDLIAEKIMEIEALLSNNNAG
jgi:flagellar biosynthesis anti-sigma factor FlgM